MQKRHRWIRPGISRLVIIAGLAVGVLAATGLLLWKWPWIRALFRSDADNPVEVSRLREAPLEVSSVREAKDWPQWLGPTRNGWSPPGPLRLDWDQRPPIKLWQTACGGGYSSLALADGKLYLHDRAGGPANAAVERLRAFNAETGEVLWEYTIQVDYSRMRGQPYDTGPRATPAIDADRIYAVGATGVCFCLQLSQADAAPRELWRHDLTQEFDADIPEWGFASSPLIEGDMVIVQPGGRQGSVAAFDKLTGQFRWKAATNPNGYSSPVAADIAGRRVILAMTGDALLALDTQGRVLAEHPWSTSYNGNIATPIVVGDYVFISSGYEHGCAVLRGVAEGNRFQLEPVLFRKKVLRNHHATSIYHDGFLYGFDGDLLMKCVDFRTLEVKWESREPGKGCAILANRHLIVLTQRGDLALVEATPEECRLRATVPSGLSRRHDHWALPILVNGRLYLRDQDKVLCYDVR